MSDVNIDDDFDDYNAEALERAADDLRDHNYTASDHIRAAQRTIHRCIDVITDARLDSGALSGRALDDHLQQLIEIEGDLSRAEGELADAGPYSGF